MEYFRHLRNEAGGEGSKELVQELGLQPNDEAAREAASRPAPHDMVLTRITRQDGSTVPPYVLRRESLIKEAAPQTSETAITGFHTRR